MNPSAPAESTTPKDSRPSVGVVIPAHDPDEGLLDLVAGLHERGLTNIIVVDDGSGPKARETLRRLPTPCTVLTHAAELGKGRALKTGLNHGFLAHPDLNALVTVDSNGQHFPDDVAKVARAIDERSDRLVIGSRRFDQGMPRLSQAGNAVTRLVMLILTGLRLADPQCGLRGIPRDLVPDLLGVRGEGLDWELNALVTMARRRVAVHEVQIRTCGLDPRAPGFNPALDSLTIYFLLVRFSLSSLLCAGVDTGIYYVLINSGIGLGTVVFAARAVSSLLNFALNRSLVFRSDRSVFATAVLYYSLVLVIGVLSYLSIRSLHEWLGLGMLSSKVVSETVLFLLSFLVQRDLVFRRADWDSR